MQDIMDFVRKMYILLIQDIQVLQNLVILIKSTPVKAIHLDWKIYIEFIIEIVI